MTLRSPQAGMAHPNDRAGTQAGEATDEDLMRSYQGGDQRAFRVLFARYAGRIFSFLLHRTGSSPLAEDLTQKTWLQVHRARATFREGAPFAPWLYTIAANLRRDELRAQVRRSEHLTADGTPPEPTPEQTAGAEQQRADAVRQAVSSLPEAYRDVILLHRWHDFGFAQIAQILCTTEGAVKLRAHRGYLLLKDLLTKGGLS